MKSHSAWRAVVFVALVSPGLAVAQNKTMPGSSAGNPFPETSAGRAWQRITFGAIDCGTGLSAGPSCPNDAFTTSGLFVNGTYQNIRFFYDGQPVNTPAVADFLSNRVITQSQTFPQASSASGFTFTWNGPTPTLDSKMFGPLFGERGRTNGRQKLSATLSVQSLRWETLDSSKIRNDQEGLLWGENAYTTGSDGTSFGYVGRCKMNIDSWVASLALTYGVTDRLDITAGVPLVHTSVEGSNEFIDYAIAPGGVPVGGLDATGFAPQGRFYVKGSSTGIGDMMLGATYAFIKKERSAFAAMARVNLGTGSYDKMTGTGETQLHVGLVGSYETGWLAPHFDLSYLGANSTLFDEGRLVIGFDARAIPNRLTLSAEMLERFLFDGQGFTATSTFGTLKSPITGDTFEVNDFAPSRQRYNLYFVSLGGKVRIAGQLLGTGFVLIPWGSSGLIAQKPSLNFGLNYAF